MNEIAIIGAGPAGLATAIKLKEEGFDSVVFEEHEKIGVPENCSGLVSKSGMDALGVDVSEVTVNEIRGAKIYSPKGDMIRVTRNKPVAYLMDRARFDQLLLKKAQNLNIHVATNTKLIDIRKNTLFVQKDGRGEIRKAEKIVGADGVSSTIRHLMEIKTSRENFVHTMQATATGDFEKEYVSVYTGNFAKGFFAWVIPITDKKAKIGIGCTLGEDVNENFKKFVNEKLEGVRVYGTKSFLVPYSSPLKGIVKDNMALVGDSAFQTKATSGGGIIFGMRAGEVLAKTLADNIKHKTPLTEYEKRCGEINKELRMHWKIRKYANSLSDEQASKLFLKIKEKGIEEFLEQNGDMDNPSEFIGKLAKSPKYWFMAKTLIDIARS